MDIGTTMSVVQTLLVALQCSHLKDFCTKKSISSQLDQLQLTIRRIQGVLEDAEAKQVLSKHEEAYIEELKDVVYEADDLFDEFLTLAHQKKLNEGIKDRLLSLFTKLKLDYTISQKVDNIKQKLDNIVSTNKLISFKHDPDPIKKRSRETCSYVHAFDIIGRDDDLEKIVSMLLHFDGNRPVSFLSIVGIGGLGKTALAQLVFNDPRITSAFPLKLWTCVCDEEDFDEKEIIGKILEAATNHKHHDATKDRLQSQVRQQLEGKKYLIVLDDVWTEIRDQWCKLVDFLMGGQRGSWILVTTRSKRTARIVGNGLMHELQGLSKENSLRLFERVAFGSEVSNPPEDLINIGRKIVERCANIPLAIRVVGSLLYGQDKQKWLSFQELPLAKFDGNKSGIMPILKLSYSQLEFPLKSCFGYCALFPKDYVIEKKTLMRLWMAQGYIPLGDLRSMEDVAEEFFMVLLRRCFFHDVQEDRYGEIYSCKLHDLMHDVAQEVVGKDIFKGDGIIDGKVRHISTTREIKSYNFNTIRIRSYLQVCSYYVEGGEMDQVSVHSLLSNLKYLRVLDLSNLNIKSLPSSIGELLHLRYLDLSCNHNLEILPKQISKLYNLETLNLQRCSILKELPKFMSKLVKLRVLDVRGCDRLSSMPRGMGSLSCLEELTMFVVGEANFSPQKHSNGLEDLKGLTNLKGDLKIKIGFCKKDGNEEKYDGGEGGCLSNKAHLTSVELRFSKEKCEGRAENDETIIEELQPHFHLKGLEMWCYEGVRMPKWAREHTLANLVNIMIKECPNLQSLGCLGTLHHLKLIQVEFLRNLEWLIENENREGSRERGASSEVQEVGVMLSKPDDFSFFPSLETLSLYYMPKLKGWWRVVGMGDNHQLLRLPRLKVLIVRNCPNLTAFVDCLALEELYLYKINKKLGIIKTRRKVEEKEKCDEQQTTWQLDIPKLQKIIIDDLVWLNSQHIDIEAFQCLQSLEITGDEEVESLGEVQEVFRSCCSSLRSLKIRFCSNLRSVSGGLEHLTTMERLVIEKCPELRLSEESMDVNGNCSGMPWKSLKHSLRTLKLLVLPQMVNLPSWMQYLTALETLDLSYCGKLISMPNWMPKLTSLRVLRLINCSKYLKKRCQESTGEDWPHIQHISSITIKDRGW